MWSYFSSKLAPIKLAEKEAEKPAAKLNWCLFEANGTGSGSGIFFSSLEPGIKDYNGGILYVVPCEFMERKEEVRPGVKKRLTAHKARAAILEYYGIIVDYNPKKYHEFDLVSY